MAAQSPRALGVLALLPYFVKGSLPLFVLREMRARGLDVTLSWQEKEVPGHSLDPVTDFRAQDRVVDLTGNANPGNPPDLERLAEARGIGLMLLVGADRSYVQLARLRERRPDIRQLDWLFNTGPHFHNFYRQAGCFDGVLVESETMSERLIALPEIGRVWRIGSGVDLAAYRPVGRAVAPLPESLVLGYLGRMSAEKNPLGFVELAERVHALTAATRFLMYGEGNMVADVQARIAASPARAAIHFAGHIAKAIDAFAAMDVLVVPSLLDGRPAAIMEANACGVPVIANPVGGIPEQIEEGRNGFLISPREPEQVANLLAGWAAEPAQFAKLRHQAREVAEAQFDQGAMLDGYEAALRESLACPGRAVQHLS